MSAGPPPNDVLLEERNEVVDDEVVDREDEKAEAHKHDHPAHPKPERFFADEGHRLGVKDKVHGAEDADQREQEGDHFEPVHHRSWLADLGKDQRIKTVLFNCRAKTQSFKI